MIIIKLDDLIWQHRTTSDAIVKATGLGSSTISKLRNSKSVNININTLNKLCKYFNCKIYDLIDYIPD